MKRNAVKQVICYAFGMLLLGSCQTWGPTWSEVTGVRYDVTSMGVGPVLINQLDGSNPGNAPRQPIKVTPGRHTLVLQAIPPPSVVGGVHEEETTLEAAPCRRYYINARFTTPTSTDWKPFVDREEKITDCQAQAPAK
jgi:hypothetical protein